MNSILYVSLITFQFSAVFFNFLSNFPIIFGNVLFYVEELNYNKDYVKVKCEARGEKTLFILHWVAQKMKHLPGKSLKNRTAHVC